MNAKRPVAYDHEMGFFRVVYALVTMAFVIAMPFALVGWLVFDFPGLIVALFIAVTAILAAGLLGEAVVCRILDAASQPPEGLQTSLKRVIESSKGLLRLYRDRPAPRVLVFPDPAPNALVFRSLHRPGTVLLSQGLVSSLREHELRKVIERLIIECRSRGLIVSTIASVFAASVLALAPRAWVRAVFVEKMNSNLPRSRLGPTSALFFLLIYPFAELFLRVGRRERPLRTVPKGLDAIYKVPNLQSVWSLVSRPGLANLYFTEIRQ